MFVHGSVGIDHAFGEILGPELSVGAVKFDHLSVWVKVYCEMLCIFSLENMPPF